jgi:glucose/arabinose dehydrogenase
VSTATGMNGRFALWVARRAIRLVQRRDDDAARRDPPRARGRAGRGRPPPATGPASVLASGLSGPGGLAFLNDGPLAVESTTGRITRLAADGSATVLAETGESLAGLTTLRDGRLLAAWFGPGLFLANFGPAPGDGTTVLRVPYTLRGAKLSRLSLPPSAQA